MINNKQNSISKVWMIPIIVVMTIVPLILMAHVFGNGLTNHPWFGNVKYSYDIYFYYKALLIKICGAIVAVSVIGFYIQNRPSFMDEKRSYSPILALVLYSVFTILSSVFAVVPWDASFGGINRFEGSYVVLSYVFFFYFVFGYARSVELIRFLLDALLIGSIIFSLIGVIEAFGVNIYEWDWLRSIIFILEPTDLPYGVESINIVSSTLDNPNYVGSYVPLVLPYILFLLLRGEKLWRRILAGIDFILLGIFLYGSESDTGLVAVIAGVCVALFFIFPELKLVGKISLALIGIICVLIISYILLTGSFNKNFFVDKFIPNIENIETDFNNMIITTSDNKQILVTMDINKGAEDDWSNRYKIDELISIKDNKTRKLITLKNESKSRETISESGYPSLSFCLGKLSIPKELNATGKEEKMDVLYLEDGKYEFRFGTFLGANFCYYYNNGMDRVTLRNIERCGFDGMYSFANGRGYIWACTIPLLKDYLIIGAGQDNYVHIFPNDDYVGKVYHEYDSMYLTKPHNTFLGIWVQQGLIVLIAYLFLYGLFMIRVIRLCYGKKRIASSEGFSAKGVAITTAVATTGYMVAGLANDSNVGVTPIYWVMLGVGYAAEAICRKKADPSDDATKELPDVSGIIGDEDDIIVEDTIFEKL